MTLTSIKGLKNYISERKKKFKFESFSKKKFFGKYWKKLKIFRRGKKGPNEGIEENNLKINCKVPQFLTFY